MDVYCLTVLEGQEWILPSDPNDFELFSALDGSPQTNWPEPVMQLLREDEDGHERSYSDFPWLGAYAPMLTTTAAEALKKTLAPYGQLLPLRGEHHWLLNVTCVLDALDEQKSKIVRFDDGAILAVEVYEFKRDVLAGHAIFKLPGRSSPVFLTRDLIEDIRHSGLRGVSFERVWSESPSSAPLRIDLR
ncbi:imm11 family protein [Pseudorhodoplanes sinuspersici]|uniref:Immunity MXAN-0049 protein domain-containing protein n=1 Tax=Pseudorhodoplanes sinuspersici TaxID=1235591 RepID=A0A1W6ZWI8_9HYPH|nr:DUF1629 domain-containing protein [Pseudorhodoplanes sinuspersici]ARQ01680.1 hypothetical protein CAK95_23160 [Pseudorhodoplanes sinuspersici]RKE73404.1 hypothetical protein DFP91_1290 [Pseudorhodoplanes sinuspersici]